MCGIVGYVGQRDALDIVIEALRRMEYRGYDSAGVAIADGHGHIAVEKKAGPLVNLEKQIAEVGADSLSGTTGMGHTRWATHGQPTDRNAHPHRSLDGKAAVVHNGIIENYASLRDELERSGVEFSSDTDTEAAVHLLEREYTSGAHKGDFVASAYAVLNRLEGAFTVVFMHADHPDTIVAARRSTPLVVGVGKDEMFVASDVTAFIEHTRDAVELGQDEVVVITKDSFEITDFDGNTTGGKPFHIDWDLAAAEKGGCRSLFMLMRSPSAAGDRNTLLGHLETAGSCSTSSACPMRTCATSTRSSSSPAAPPITRA